MSTCTHTAPHPTTIHGARAFIGLSVHVHLNFDVFGSVMEAGWSNEVTKLTIWVEQNIQNLLNGIVWNKVFV